MPTLTAVAVTVLFAWLAWRARAVDLSGALAGAAYGVMIAVGGGWGAYALFALFVVAGSTFTRLGRQRKHRLGAAQEGGGKRTWRHATANCAVGALCAVLAGLTDQAWWPIGCAGAFAAALADTTESELGMLAGRQAYLPRMAWPMRWPAVPPGTEGAVSPAGTLLGLAAALVVATLAVLLNVMGWRSLLPVALAGLVATLIESGVGAGRDLSNERLNLLTTTAGAALAMAWVGLLG